MPPFRCCWADLPSDFLCRIGDSLNLKSYASSRGACTAWRCALAPLSPSLLLDYYSGCSPAAVSLLTPRLRSFQTNVIPLGGRCVGSSNGWLALPVGDLPGMFRLFHPVTAAQIALPPLTYETGWVSKIVFAPNPAADDFVAVAICAINRLAYVTAGARRWAILDPVRLAPRDKLTDVLYHEKGTVYCLTHHGDVHVLRLPERCRREPIMVEDSAGPSSPGPPETLTTAALALALALARLGSTSSFERKQARQHRNMLLSRSVGPDLNAPASTIEPLLSDGGKLRFNPTTSFAPPYNSIAFHTSAKNLVLCNGNLYQIWRNATCTVTLPMPGGGRLCVPENEVFVLRYCPPRQPCWDVVTDLGGYSVFVGRNNAVSLHAQGVPGLMGNCVYWIGGTCRDQGMVFDMATGTSTPCLPAGPHSTICWYFLSDMVNSCSNNYEGK